MAFICPVRQLALPPSSIRISFGRPQIEIHIDKGSYANIVGNIIENVPAAEIDITENSFARIGFRIPFSPDPFSKHDFKTMAAME